MAESIDPARVREGRAVVLRALRGLPRAEYTAVRDILSALAVADEAVSAQPINLPLLAGHALAVLDTYRLAIAALVADGRER